MRLHQNFREVADSVGPDVAARIVSAVRRANKSSVRIYVPHTISEAHSLATVLNQDQRKRLALAFGGCLLSYSSSKGLKRTREATRKRTRINALLDAGWKPSAVAAEVGVSRAYLTRFMRKRANRSNENHK